MIELAVIISLLCVWGMATMGTMFVLFIAKPTGIIRTLIASIMTWFVFFYMLLGLWTVIFSAIGYPIS